MSSFYWVTRVEGEEKSDEAWAPGTREKERRRFQWPQGNLTASRDHPEGTSFGEGWWVSQGAPSFFRPPSMWRKPWLLTFTRLPLHSPVTGLVMWGAKLTGFFLARLPSPPPSALTLHRGPPTGAGPPQPSILCNRVEFPLMGLRTGNPFASWQKPRSSTPALQAIKMKICSSSLFN